MKTVPWMMWQDWYWTARTKIEANGIQLSLVFHSLTRFTLVPQFVITNPVVALTRNYGNYLIALNHKKPSFMLLPLRRNSKYLHVDYLSSRHKPSFTRNTSFLIHCSLICRVYNLLAAGYNDLLSVNVISPHNALAATRCVQYAHMQPCWWHIVKSAYPHICMSYRIYRWT